jgi:hypothetical protein
VSFGRIACARFARLSQEAGDRSLSGHELRFVERHRAACEHCREQEQEVTCALNMLREFAVDEFDIRVSPGFDERLIRQVRVNAVRDGFRYWSPAACGALVACLALFAALHVATTPTKLQDVDVPGGQVRNTVKRYPNLELDRIPELER